MPAEAHMRRPQNKNELQIDFATAVDFRHFDMRLLNLVFLPLSLAFAPVSLRHSQVARKVRSSG